MSADRPVPYDLAAEEAVLGSLLIDRDGIRTCVDWLTAADFYRDANGAIYACIRDLYQRREPPDLVTVSSALAAAGTLEAAGGLGYLAGLMHRVPTVVHIEYYARIVQRAATLRRLIAVGGQIAGLGWTEGSELDTILSTAETLLLGVTQATRRAVDCTLSDAVDTYLQGLLARKAGTAPARGWSTGLATLDDLTLGCRPGKVWVLTGESGGGKSTVAAALALAVQAAGARVGLFSLEMDTAELAERVLANRTHLNSARLAVAQDLSAAEIDRLCTAAADLATLPPIRLVTGGGFTARDIAAQARRWQAEGGLDVLIIDYLGLVTLPRGEGVEELDRLVNGFKALAMELGITLITAAQLSNRAQGTDAKEWGNYLRGSGAIRQAADIVLTVAPQGDRPLDTRQPWPLHLGVTKHRGGPTGEVAALWWLEQSRIGEAAPAYRDWSAA